MAKQDYSALFGPQLLSLDASMRSPPTQPPSGVGSGIGAAPQQPTGVLQPPPGAGDNTLPISISDHLATYDDKDFDVVNEQMKAESGMSAEEQYDALEQQGHIPPSDRPLSRRQKTELMIDFGMRMLQGAGNQPAVITRDNIGSLKQGGTLANVGQAAAGTMGRYDQMQAQSSAQDALAAKNQQAIGLARAQDTADLERQGALQSSLDQRSQEQLATQHQNALELEKVKHAGALEIAQNKPSTANVEWKDDGALLIPVDGKTGQRVPGLDPIRKQASPTQNATDERQTKRDKQSLRKEFRGLKSVELYETVLPLYRRAATAPDTRAGDISVIYALGKMFDPTSVVRDSELRLSQNAAPWLQKMVSAAQSQVTGKGTLNPKTRQQIMETLQGQVDAAKIAYDRDYTQYSQYATEAEIDPSGVVGTDVGSAFAQDGTPHINSKEEFDAMVKAGTLKPGDVFIAPNGSRQKVK